jgi:hypothetical protein
VRVVLPPVRYFTNPSIRLSVRSIMFIHVCISHVELADRKFRVMGEINALVSENTADLVDSIESPDDKLLEVKLWRNTEIQVEVKVVVVSNKGLGSRAAGNHTRHWCFDLEETQRVKEASDIVDDTTASIEYATCVLGKNEVKIPLSIPRFLIF